LPCLIISLHLGVKTIEKS